MSGTVRVEHVDAVAVVTIDAPATRNALTPEMLCRLADAFRAFADDATPRVAVVTGTGSAAFCAGADLARTIPLLSGARVADDDWDRRLLDDPSIVDVAGLRDFALVKPVVAAVNGACRAAGSELLLGCDLRIAAEHATFAWPEVQRGLVPFAGSMARLPRQIGHAAAMRLLLTGEPIDAAEALRIGLVNEVVAADAVLPRALAVAAQIAACAPLAVQAVKRTVTATSGLPLAESWPLEDEARRAVLATRDAREGAAAFVARRPPRFEGR